MIDSKIELKDSKGKIISTEESAYLCRCGGSINKPFFDGTHKEIDFKG